MGMGMGMGIWLCLSRFLSGRRGKEVRSKHKATSKSGINEFLEMLGGKEGQGTRYQLTDTQRHHITDIKEVQSFRASELQSFKTSEASQQGKVFIDTADLAIYLASRTLGTRVYIYLYTSFYRYCECECRWKERKKTHSTETTKYASYTQYIVHRIECPNANPMFAHCFPPAVD